MKIGWIGLGKLGLPCALSLAAAGHDVAGYDIDPRPRQSWFGKDLSLLGYIEPGLIDLYATVGDDLFQITANVEATVRWAEVLFVAVQTPHAIEYDGTHPTPADTRDFEYGYLVQAVRQAVAAATRPLVLVVVSTVLPGTTDRLLRPIVHGSPVELVYSPQFIAMGTTLRDFKSPEFLLLGADEPTAAALVSDVFAAVHDAPRIACTYADAEATKVLYNTFISLKIVWANHLAQICDATGADADAVLGALQIANDRILSDAYLSPGMGDGGACHPRDLIALADLERRHGLTPFFTNLAQMRDIQSLELANLAVRWSQLTGLADIVLLGMAYKPEVPLEDGSPARLLAGQLAAFTGGGGRVWLIDPHSRPDPDRLTEALGRPRVFIQTTNHPHHRELDFPSGSVVIDPWGTLPQRSPGVTYVRPGRR